MAHVCHLIADASLCSFAITKSLRTKCHLWCQHQEFKSRLDTLSIKLHGVDNMLGHQLAVHEMAGLLGVAVAQVSLLPL